MSFITAIPATDTALKVSREQKQSNRRRRLGRTALALLAVMTAGCSSGSNKATGSSSSTTASSRPTATLEFRKVESSQPTNGRPCVKPAGAAAVFSDRTGRTCYAVGPVLLTGANIDSTTVTYDGGDFSWSVEVHFKNDDFLTKIAGPLVGRRVAILVNGVVGSAPTLNPGITGRTIEISPASSSRTDTVNFAASILGISPSNVKVSHR